MSIFNNGNKGHFDIIDALYDISGTRKRFTLSERAERVLVRTATWDHAIEVLGRHMTSCSMKEAIKRAYVRRGKIEKHCIRPTKILPPQGCTRSRHCPNAPHCLCGYRHIL